MVRGTGERLLALVALALVALVAGGVWLGGGLRVAPDYIPPASLNERLDMRRFEITVLSVERTNLDGAGEVRTRGSADVIQLRCRVVLTDTAPARFVARDFVLVTPAGSVDELPLESSLNPGSVPLQPGVPEEVLIDYDARSLSGDRVELLVAAPQFAWTNLINRGPQWSAGRAEWVGRIRDVQPVDRRARAGKSS